MPRSESESPVTVVLEDDSGHKVSCSALLQRDPGFLSWNRISLIGSEEDEHGVWNLFSKKINWHLPINNLWPGAEEYRHETYGVAFIRSIGRAHGLSLQEDAVQKFADLRVQEHTEITKGSGRGGLAAQFWFLQRPVGWWAHSRRPRVRATLDSQGDWVTLRKLGLKVRLVSVGHLRRDPRRSVEDELICIPGAEVQPLGETDADEFFSAADDLWFSLRILIIFWERQHVWPVAEFRQQAGRYAQTWQPLEVDPRVVVDQPELPPTTGPVSELIAKGAVVLAQHKAYRELLHAASFGYAMSYKVTHLEDGLTSCVEAIERLIGVIEAGTNLRREIISPSGWRQIASELKRVVDATELPKEIKARVKRALASPVSLSLEERVRRIIELQKGRWSSGDLKLAEGLGEMIKARNDIVHGRLSEDLDNLYIQVTRARAVFQTLFLNFIGCRLVRRDGSAESILCQYEAGRRNPQSI